jgi:biopolymer transport protein TolQ
MFLFLAQASTPALGAPAVDGAAVAGKINMWGQVFNSGGVVLMVLLVLIAMSIATWFIIGYKWLFLTRVKKETDQFLKSYWDDKRWEALAARAAVLDQAPVSRMFKNGYKELRRIRDKSRDAQSGVSGANGVNFTLDDAMQNIKRQLTRTMGAEAARLERFISFLATVGTSAPFIGLFGTVWGIMNAFAYINPNRPILETVTPHIAEALIATAIGLFAAIPAVIAYNTFVSKIRWISTEMDNFANDFLNDLSRMDIGDRDDNESSVGRG